jgi:hypothetical protein
MPIRTAILLFSQRELPCRVRKQLHRVLDRDIPVYVVFEDQSCFEVLRHDVLDYVEEGKPVPDFASPTRMWDTSWS